MQKLQRHKKKTKTIVLIVILILSTYLFVSLDLNKIGDIIGNWGFLGQIVYVLYLVVSVVISPLISIPLWITAYAAYGFWLAVILTSIGNLFGGMCAFLIARKYGRSVVARFAGNKSLKKIDEFAGAIGWKTFFILRLLTNNYFDYVSYAAGISNVSTKTYFVITAITAFIWSIFIFLVIQGTYNITKVYTLTILIVFFIALIPVLSKLLSIFNISNKIKSDE